MYREVQKWQSTQYPALFPLIKDVFEKETPKDPIVRINLEEVSKTKECFVLLNVLSREECKALMDASEKMGFEDAENYCYMYRDRYNDRLMSDDDDFTATVFKRIESYLPKDYGHWQLKGLNNRWRYCRYYKGHYFGAHTDGIWKPNAYERSILTCMLYLNGANDKEFGFEGGSTDFLTRNGTVKKQVIPETGSCLVFEQEDMDMYHKGAKLISGTKYILRTDVMYNIQST